MAYLDYDYDPTATKAANRIVNETVSVDVSVDRGIFPLHGPFYGDLNGFAIRGRNGSGAYQDLVPEVDFQYSPMFLEASAKTGKQVFTYVVLITQFDQLQIDYRVLGTYNDKELIAQIAASTHDRSVVHEWSRIWGDDAAYNPRVRDPDLHDKSYIEVVNAQLEKILNAIALPASGSAFTLADATKLQLNNQGAATVIQLKEDYKEPTVEPEPVADSIPKEVISIPDTFSMCSFLLGFTATSGKSHLLQVMIARNGTDIDQTIVGEVSSDDDVLILDVTVADGLIKTQITAGESGTISTKILFAV